MSPNEIARVQTYLRRLFKNDTISIQKPRKPNQPVEVSVGGEFVGVLHRDDDEGDISWSLTITVLEIDLPPAGAVR
jgi:hypothetical protein